jgi:hypothetical protein
MGIIQLPTKKSSIKTSIYDYTTLIHGVPKIGKSTFCAEMEGALFIPFEPGLDALSVHQIPVEKWTDLGEIYSLLKTGDHNFKVVIWDTASAAYDLCLAHIAEIRGTHPENEDYGKGWNAVNAKFVNGVSKFASLPTGLVLISHSKELNLKSRTGEYIKMVPAFSPTLRNMLNRTVATTLYFSTEQITDKDGETTIERRIFTTPSLYHEAGTRIRAFKDVPKTLPLDFHAFAELFEQKLTDGQKQTDKKEKE